MRAICGVDVGPVALLDRLARAGHRLHAVAGVVARRVEQVLEPGTPRQPVGARQHPLRLDELRVHRLEDARRLVSGAWLHCAYAFSKRAAALRERVERVEQRREVELRRRHLRRRRHRRLARIAHRRVEALGDRAIARRDRRRARVAQLLDLRRVALRRRREVREVEGQHVGARPAASPRSRPSAPARGRRRTTCREKCVYQ